MALSRDLGRYMALVLNFGNTCEIVIYVLAIWIEFKSLDDGICEIGKCV